MARRASKAHNPGNVEARIKARIEGLQKLPSTVSLDVAGVPSAPSQLASELQTREAKYQVADLAHRTLTDAVKDRNDAEPETLSRLDDVDAAIVAHFGASSSQLADFGMTPKKDPRKLSAEELVAREKKAAETRAENHPKPAPKPADGGPPASGKAVV